MTLRPERGLWQHSDFLKLWSAETVSQFGTQFSALALPLTAVIVLHASVFEIAALNVVEFLPFVLVSLPAGVWVDRLPRRPILVLGDLARAGLLISIPIAYAFDALTIWQLYAVGFLVGIATVFFDVAYQSYLPALVDRHQLVEGNSKLEISRSTAQLGGPGLAGVLVDLLSAPVAIVFDAVSYLGSALLIFRIRKAEPPSKHEAPALNFSTTIPITSIPVSFSSSPGRDWVTPVLTLLLMLINLFLRSFDLELAEGRWIVKATPSSIWSGRLSSDDVDRRSRRHPIHGLIWDGLRSRSAPYRPVLCH